MGKKFRTKKSGHRCFSRTTRDGMTSVELSSSITLAQEAVRFAVTDGLHLPVAHWNRWEILLPPKKNRELEEFHDPDGACLRAELEDAAIEKMEATGRDVRKFRVIQSTDMYAALQVENNDAIEMRHVFFKAIAVLEGHRSVDVRAVVKVWAISGWWNDTDVKIWVRQQEGDFEHHGSFAFGGSLRPGHKKVSSRPPEFLRFIESPAPRFAAHNA